MLCSARIITFQLLFESRVPAVVTGHLRIPEFLDKKDISQTKTKITQEKNSSFSIVSQRPLVSTLPDSFLGSMFFLLSSAVAFGR